MKRLLLVTALLLVSLVRMSEAQVFYKVDSAEKVITRSVTSISSIATPPIKLVVLSGDGAKFARIGVPLLITIKPWGTETDVTGIEEDSVSAIIDDTLVISKRAISNTVQQQWPAGSRISVTIAGPLLKQLQTRYTSFIGDTTGKTGYYHRVKAGGGFEWAAISGAAATGVITFNGRTDSVQPLAGDYSFWQLNGTAAVTQGGTGLNAIDPGKLLYADAANSLHDLTLGDGLSITNDTLNVAIPASAGGTLTSVGISGGVTGLGFLNSPLTGTGGTMIAYGTLAIGSGGTGGTTAQAAATNILGSSGDSGDVLMWNGGAWLPQANPAGFSNPLTTLGDIMTMNSVPAVTRVAGNTSDTVKVLAELGNGVTASLPYWVALCFDQICGTISTSQYGTIPINKGGTGQITATAAFDALSPLTTTGDILGFSGGHNVRIAIGANGKLFKSNGTTGSWAFADFSELTGSVSSGQLPVVGPGKGGTGQSATPSDGDVLVGSGGVFTPLPIGLPHKVLMVNNAGTGLLYSNADMSYVQNVLGVTNGGTGVNSSVLGDVLYGSGSNTFAALAGNTTTTKKFFSETGDGVNSAAPGWVTIAAGDVPTLNQNTTGSAATLTTPRAIYGNNFDGSAALAQIIASTYGGTGNGFTKLSGPTTAEKTFTLPDASATILTDNATVTVAQGGTGLATITANSLMAGNGTSAVALIAPGTSGNLLTSDGTQWQSTAPSATLVMTTGNQTVAGNKTFSGATTTSGTLTYGSAEYLNVSAPHVTNYTIGATDQFVLADATSGPITITLQATPTVGRHIYIVKIDVTANAVTVARNGNDFLDGASDITLASAGSIAELVYTGTATSKWAKVSVQ